MISKNQRQSSRNAMDIHRQFGRTGRAYKITPLKYAKKLSRWERVKEWIKSRFSKRTSNEAS